MPPRDFGAVFGVSLCRSRQIAQPSAAILSVSPFSPAHRACSLRRNQVAGRRQQGRRAIACFFCVLSTDGPSWSTQIVQPFGAILSVSTFRPDREALTVGAQSRCPSEPVAIRRHRLIFDVLSNDGPSRSRQIVQPFGAAARNTLQRAAATNLAPLCPDSPQPSRHCYHSLSKGSRFLAQQDRAAYIAALSITVGKR